MKTVGRSPASAPLVLRACGIAVATLSALHTAHAYRTGSDLPEFRDAGPVHWHAQPITLELVKPLPAGVTANEVRRAIEEALSAWSEPSCSGVELSLASESASEAGPADEHNTIEWVFDWSARGFDTDLPAVTDVQYTQDGPYARIVEADIYLNADFDWQPRASPVGNGSPDVLAVVTHEAGHVLGLLHPCEVDSTADPSAPSCVSGTSWEDSTMYPIFAPSQSTLAKDDVDGVCALYPADPDDGSTAGEECSARACGSDAGARPATGPCDGGSTCQDAGCSGPGCSADKLATGETCDSPDECEDNRCLSGMTSAPVCTRDCGPRLPDCPADWSCVAVDDEPVCVPPDSSGCAISGAGKNAPRGATLPTLLAMMITLSYRRMRRMKGRCDVRC